MFDKIKNVISACGDKLDEKCSKTVDITQDYELDTPSTVKAITTEDLQRKEFIGFMSGQHFENKPEEIKDGAYVWKKADEFMRRFLSTKGYMLVKSEIFDDCIGYHCYQNEKPYVIYMFAYGKEKKILLDGEYCDKFLRKPFNNVATALVAFLCVKRYKKGNEIEYRVGNYCGDVDTVPDFWKVSVIDGKTVLQYFPGEDTINLIYRFMYAFNHDSLDAYDCVMCKVDPHFCDITNTEWIFNTLFYNNMIKLHKEYGEMKVGYVRYNDVIYSMAPYLEGYGFFKFRFYSSANCITHVEACPFEGINYTVKEFIKTHYRESQALFNYPKLIGVTSLLASPNYHFVLKLLFDNGECRKYALPLSCDEENKKVIDYYKYEFTDEIKSSAHLELDTEPVYEGYPNRAPYVVFENGFTIYDYECYENSTPFTVPNIVDEKVYEDDSYIIKRIWKWDVRAIYEDEDTGLIKTLVAGQYFNHNSWSTYVTVDGRRLCDLDFDYIEDFHEGLALVCVYGCGYGFVDKDMNFVIPMQYRLADSFVNGMAKVKKDEERYFIDKTGQEIKIQAPGEGIEYEEIGNFYEGLCRVSTLKLRGFDLAYFSDYDDIAGIWGFVNEKGNLVIEPQYIFANDFEDGFAIVCKGKWTIDKKWDNEYNTGRYWSEEQKWGAIDKSGKEVIPFVFDEIKNFYDTRDAFIAHYGGWKEGHWGVIDNRGNWLAEPIFEDIDYDFQDGLFAFYKEDKWNDDNVPLGIYDTKQKKVIFEPQFTDVSFFEDGWIKVEFYDEKLGRKIEKVIDINGKEKFHSVYSYIYRNQNNYEVVINDENGYQKGLVDKDGNTVIPCSKDIDEINCKLGIIFFKQNDRTGVKDFDGNIIIPPRYKSVYNVNLPFAHVKIGDDKESYKGLITLDGREVLPPIYEYIRWTKDHNHILCKGNNGCEMLEVITKDHAPAKNPILKSIRGGYTGQYDLKSDGSQKKSKTKFIPDAIPIGEKEFLQKIGRMYSDCVMEDIVCHMELNFKYSSFWVFTELKTAMEYEDYITKKIKAIRKSNNVVKTRMMHFKDTGKPCLLLEQAPGTEPACLFVERSKNGLIARMDMMPSGMYKLVE